MALKEPAVEEGQPRTPPRLRALGLRPGESLVEQRLEHLAVEVALSEPPAEGAREPSPFSLEQPPALKEVAEERLGDDPQRDALSAARAPDALAHRRTTGDALSYRGHELSVVDVELEEEPLGDPFDIKRAIDRRLIPRVREPRPPRETADNVDVVSRRRAGVDLELCHRHRACAAAHEPGPDDDPFPPRPPRVPHPDESERLIVERLDHVAPKGLQRPGELRYLGDKHPVSARGRALARKAHTLAAPSHVAQVKRPGQLWVIAE